jgi:hypothetical protein
VQHQTGATGLAAQAGDALHLGGQVALYAGGAGQKELELVHKRP